jgi:hypothetical protein
MDGWDLEDLWDWEEFDDYRSFLYDIAETLAELVFLSNPEYLPNAGDDYNLTYLETEDWWPLVKQLDELLDLEAVTNLLDELDPLLNLSGLPTELLEAPLAFLASALAGNLPSGPSGRRVGSRNLVKITRLVIGLTQEFPATAQAAIRAWADVHRNRLMPSLFQDYDEEDWIDLLLSPDLPPAVTGFSMMIGMTLMRWPDRAEGMPIPDDFLDPELYDEILAQWEALPDSPTATGEEIGEAEFLFAQGQLAHTLAQLGDVEGLGPDEVGDEDLNLAYSRLSRAILWLHNQCRICPEREGVTCKVADNWPERPVPLLDVCGEIASTGRIGGCVNM